MHGLTHSPTHACRLTKAGRNKIRKTERKEKKRENKIKKKNKKVASELESWT